MMARAELEEKWLQKDELKKFQENFREILKKQIEDKKMNS